MEYVLGLLVDSVLAVTGTFVIVALPIGFIVYCVDQERLKTLLTGVFMFLVGLGMLVLHLGRGQ